jgi:histidinol phosphatase-like PHP family hydrolase
MYNLEHLPLIALYAEIHFRFFPFFPSFLFRREPEVLFDCPRRLDPGFDLPVSLIVHDCVRFPMELVEVSIAINGASFPITIFSFQNCIRHEISHPLQPNLRSFIFSIPREKLPSGEVFINAKAVLKGRKNRLLVILNDNIPTSSRLAFSCRISAEPLPASTICSYGDMHVHSSYSESHVEFGHPIEVISKSAAACGLNFINITDHSYDLSCSLANYLTVDSTHARWESLINETKKTFDTIVLQGEEVSCLNNTNQVVHLCAAQLKEYIPGSLDGARGKNNRSEQLTIPQTIDEIHHQNGIAFAAHPGSKKTLMQSLFLRRGHWNEQDCCNSALDGFQAYNGSFSHAWKRALSLWLTMLKNGQRVPLLAGNDAHGDFNRYRSIKTPFFSVFESTERYFANGRTGLYAKCSNRDDVLSAVRNGKTFVTDGPYVSINSDITESSTIINSTGVPFSSTSIFVHCASNIEYGRLQKVIIYGLKASASEESVLLSENYQELTYSRFQPVTTVGLQEFRYLRAELHSVRENGIVHKAFSSCCFNTAFN